MRLRNIKNAKEIIENSKYIILNPEENKGKWRKIFNNDNPIYIEIGMGKGKFILENALKYKDINFIGIEKFDSVMARAIKKIDKYELDNLKLIRIDAKEINSVFDKEIDIIYLNFSDPWPKDRHEIRRLTHKGFLIKYDDIFKNKKIIEMKTDNKNLFEYSVVSLSKYGYIIEEISVNAQEEITTEYEDKFIKLGNPIYKIKCMK